MQGHAGPRDPLGFPELVLDEQGRFAANPQFEWAGGGFVTNAGALARWGRALFAGDVLRPELRERMVAGQPAPGLGRGVAYGLGAIVSETALLNALASGRLGGVGLDVYDVEPLPLDHPLRRFDNAILMSHRGYDTKEILSERYEQAIENILKFVEGKPLNLLNPDVQIGK